MGKQKMVKSRAISAIVVFCLVVGVTGCSAKTATTNELKLLESAGIQNTVNVGDSFKVVLKGNPTTGYAWHYTIEDNKVVEFTSESNIPDSNDPEVVGAGSTFTWNFKALKAGQTTIIYKYYRAWEGEASTTAENALEYLVSVNP